MKTKHMLAEIEACKILRRATNLYNFLHIGLACVEFLTVLVAIGLFLYIFLSLFYAYQQTGVDKTSADYGKLLLALGGAISSTGAFTFAGKKRKIFWQIADETRRQYVRECRDIHLTDE